MPTTTLMPLPKQQFFSNVGVPLAGGKIYTYEAGTSIPKLTYSDPDGAVPQENGIPLNLRGEPDQPIYWSGNYRVEVREASGKIVYNIDNFNTDPAGIWDTLAKTLDKLFDKAASSLIGFIQAGSGAVKQSVQDVLREHVSVKNFGAKGDGMTDDSAAIQRAIDYASTFDRGRKVYLPPGTYIVKTTLTVFYDRVGLYGDGATIVLSKPSAANYPLFLVTYGDRKDFPSYSVMSFEGLRLICDTPLMGFAFRVQGKGIDQFAAQTEFKNLNIQGFYAAWEFGDYAFAPVVSKCAVTGCNQVLRSKGQVAAGAHYVFEKCLFTEVGLAAGNIPVFDLGPVQTYKILACDIEAVYSTIFVSTGAELYIAHTHFEVDVGKVGHPLFVVDNPEYGHMVLAFCTGFIWMSASVDVPFWTSGNRIAAFVVTDSRIILPNLEAGKSLVTPTLLQNYGHKFLCNKAMVLRSPLNPATGQALMYSGQNNNGFSNAKFLRPFTEDFTQGGAGDPITISTDGPIPGASSLVLPRSRFVTSAMFEITDGAQMGMITHWGKTTFYTSGQVSLEIRLFNANKQQTFLFVKNITNQTVGTWDRFEIDTLRSISDKTNKYIQLTYSCPDGCAYQLGLPFVDFA